MTDAKKLAKRYRKQYLSRGCTLSAIQRALEAQGYQVVRFHPDGNDEPTEIILQALSLEDYARSAKGFTYADSDHRLVFLHADLTQEESRLVLLHEQGHILCGHLQAAAILGQDVLQEFEANEFVHFLLTPSPFRRFGTFLRRHKALVAICAGILAVGCALAIAIPLLVGSKTYLVTPTGQKYHTQDCRFLKNKTTAQEMTLEELEENHYAPCEYCITE